MKKKDKKKEIKIKQKELGGLNEKIKMKQK